MVVGFTGSQSGMTAFQKEIIPEVLDFKHASEFCHGDCIGSDAESTEIAFDWGIRIFTIFPPTDTKKRAWCFLTKNQLDIPYGQYQDIIYKETPIKVKWMTPEAYLERNKRLVDYVLWMIACPKEQQHTLRSGTWATIRYAWKVKREITVIPPIIRND